MASSAYLVATSASVASTSCWARNRSATLKSGLFTPMNGCSLRFHRQQSSTIKWTTQRCTSPMYCATLPESDQPYLKDLQVPSEWVTSPAAAQEAEWLRGALHQWLDDEYCPEPANEEISRRCAKVYYYCLMEEQVDIGDILMQMVRDLETFSFKESFHGAFTSANAAIDLITKRMESIQQSN